MSAERDRLQDGLAGIRDDRQILCLALAVWNGRDPYLKERMFGLGGPEGNHGEDVKECWWYVDSTPTHSWMRWRYMYPQAAFPYERLRDENRARGRDRPELELLDTGIFDDGRYWEITADYAKASPEDILARITARNAGPETATIDLLPTLWFRNTWSWDAASLTPSISVADGGLAAVHPELGRRILSHSGDPDALFCDNESNEQRLWGAEPDAGPRYPKDGIGDHIVSGAPSVNPEQRGTKAALRYRLTVEAGAAATIELRLREPASPGDNGPGEDFAVVMDG